MAASQEGKTDDVELLLKHNADVNARTEVRVHIDREIGRLLFVHAYKHVCVPLSLGYVIICHPQCCWYVVVSPSVCGNISVFNIMRLCCQIFQSGWTALMVASFDGKTDVVELLIKHNADVNARTEVRLHKG